GIHSHALLPLVYAIVRMQLKGKQGASLAWIGSTCAAPATVSEKRRHGGLHGAAEPASMSTRKAASAYHHWARNHSSGKGKRRFRQPGYRPEHEGRTPRGSGAALMTSYPYSAFPWCSGKAVVRSRVLRCDVLRKACDSAGQQ